MTTEEIINLNDDEIENLISDIIIKTESEILDFVDFIINKCYKHYYDEIICDYTLEHKYNLSSIKILKDDRISPYRYKIVEEIIENSNGNIDYYNTLENIKNGIDGIKLLINNSPFDNKHYDTSCDSDNINKYHSIEDSLDILSKELFDIKKFVDNEL